MNDATAWLKATQRETTVRVPSWIPSVNQAPTIHEELAPEEPFVETSAELEEARAERDAARQALEAVEHELEAARAQLAALHTEAAALGKLAADGVALAARIREETIASAEPDLVNLATAIAERVVGRELTADPTLIVGWAHEGLSALHTHDTVVIALSADLFPSLPHGAFAVEGHEVEVVLDDDLGPGCCEVRSKSGRVEENVRSRIAAVLEALGSEA